MNHKSMIYGHFVDAEQMYKVNTNGKHNKFRDE